MNQDLMIRLFRAIDGDINDDIVKVASKIIEDEKIKGHNRLADKLKNILEKNVVSNIHFKNELKSILPAGTSIPTDKRNNVPLASIVERDNLRHDMILSSETEYKIHRIEKEYVARQRLLNYGLKPRQKVLVDMMSEKCTE